MTPRLLPARVTLLAACALTLGPANAFAPRAPGQQCAKLVLTRHPALEVLSATMVPGGQFAAAEGQTIKVPSSCRVVGVARPTADSQIGFELWLPDGWNGRYSQLGNGGFAGNIDQASLAHEIQRGNAAAMTDTGHKAGQFDASWALGHPEKVVDYGYRSIKVTANAAKWLINDYYGRTALRRYFIGCSNGGRQALVAAQRYPDDWDGILAGSPAVQWTKQLATFAAIQHRLRARPENWIPTAKLRSIQREAVASCVPASVSAGVPTDPRLCRFDSQRLLCKVRETSECLTAAQMKTLDLIRLGPLDARTGRRLHYGFEPTSAAVPANWDQWILNPNRDAPSQMAFATQAYRYLMLDRPDWQVEQFDAARDFARAERLSAVLDADLSDLTRFAGRGGKLIMYVGWADAVISPAAGLAYYQKAIGRMGGAAQAKRSFQLFMVPGMQHCQGGLAPNAFGQARVAPALRADARHDIRLALEEWVELRRPPQTIVAAAYEPARADGAAIAKRELRPYPQSPGPILAVR